MVAILRHDVDSAYVNELRFGKLTRLCVTNMNRLNVRFGNFLPGIPRLEYLHDAERLFEAEKSLGIKSTWFFRRRTRPHRDFARRLLRHGCEIAFHADRTHEESIFLKDLRWTVGDNWPVGFSKHGSARNQLEAEERGCEIYDASECLGLAIRHGFKYFAGNGTDPEQSFRVIGGVVYFPGAFWMFPGYMQDTKYTLEWLIRNHRDTDVVVLIHPREYTDLYPRVKERIDTLLSRVDEVVAFRQFIGSLRDTSQGARED